MEKLTAFESQTLEVLLDSILPAQPGVPDAQAVGAMSMCRQLVSRDAAAAACLKQCVGGIDAIARRSTGTSFMSLPLAERTRLFERIVRAEDGAASPALEGLRLLRRLAVGAFMSSEAGISYLGCRGALSSLER